MPRQYVFNRVRHCLNIIRDTPTITPNTILPNGMSVAEYSYYYIYKKIVARQRRLDKIKKVKKIK